MSLVFIVRPRYIYICIHIYTHIWWIVVVASSINVSDCGAREWESLSGTGRIQLAKGKKYEVSKWVYVFFLSLSLFYLFLFCFSSFFAFLIDPFVVKFILSSPAGTVLSVFGWNQ